jgi:hypothetical protein
MRGENRTIIKREKIDKPIRSCIDSRASIHGNCPSMDKSEREGSQPH